MFVASVGDHARDEGRAARCARAAGRRSRAAPTMPGMTWHVAHAYWWIASLPRSASGGELAAAGARALRRRAAGARRAILRRRLAAAACTRYATTAHRSSSREPILPRRHARHLDAVLDHPVELRRRPFARGVREIRRQRHEAERERLAARRRARRGIARNARRRARVRARSSAGSASGGTTMRARVPAHRLAHADLRAASTRARVRVRRRDVVEARVDERARAAAQRADADGGHDSSEACASRASAQRVEVGDHVGGVRLARP